jgi:hypothetical protein
MFSAPNLMGREYLPRRSDSFTKAARAAEYTPFSIWRLAV